MSEEADNNESFSRKQVVRKNSRNRKGRERRDTKTTARTDPVILFLWSRQSKYSEEVLQYLFQTGLASNTSNAIVHSICIDNKVYREIISKNKNGIKATVIPCFVVTIEINGEKSTTVIDRPEDMKEFTSSLIEQQK